MPAPKPRALIERHETAAEKSARESREAALQPARQLPVDAPARLNGHQVAAAAWRRLIREYNSIQGVIVTRLDLDLLLDYCMLLEQTTELDRMRKVAYEIWMQFSDKRHQLVKDGKADEALEMAIKTAGAFDAVIKLDGRVDRKRDLMLKLRQSLYLTPRARAGAAPPEKQPAEPEDPLAKLLDSVTDFLNGEGDEK